MGHLIAFFLKHEKPLLLTFFGLLALIFLHGMILPQSSGLALLIALTVIILLVMLYGIFHVVHHADILAEKLGEPYGTLILTLAVISVEVALIVSLMLSSHADEMLARNTMFSVMMIAVNAYVGVSLFLGGLRHRTQHFNLHGASAYLAALIPLSVICLVLPSYIHSGPISAFSSRDSVVVIMICALIYAVFLIMQTKTHPAFFKTKEEIASSQQSGTHTASRGILYHLVLLLCAVLIMVFLSKQLSVYLAPVVTRMHLPNMLEGLIVAMLILMPEGYSAVMAAKNNELQRSVNLCMGSALATIALTVPSVLIICLILGKSVTLGLSPVDSILLALTLFVSVTTFTSRETHFLHGAVHFVLFLVYLLIYF